ncbi:uncharacterized protein LOC141697823 [Apium graveolens]|uniref:uncharacterized protein LOC141697823 n=1 Tax=Apium graveolens TaxID=4045 RepID=UPI003D7A8350
MTCPCRNCKNNKWQRREFIYDHLICSGPYPLYVNWIVEVSQILSANNGSEDEDMDWENNLHFGDNLDEMLDRTNGPNVDSKRFYEEGKQPLYPDYKKFSRLSFIVRLYSLKCVHRIMESGFGDILKLIRDAFPEANVPLSFYAAKNDSCKTCGLSRWIVREKKGTSDSNPEKVIHKVTANMIRYFPLKPRLQRLFMCKDFSELMVWHAVGHQRDGKLRHPADAEAWKTMDARYPQFASKNRNIRLGLVADGFNHFRTMNTNHSTWPIVLVNYNLPPWLCMKPENLILSTLISGPNSPKNSIDVYMQPLVAELTELWNEGIQTYYAFTDQTFILRASILWTISDFPGYAMLSGWGTKGYLGCPVCNYETSSMYLKYSKKMCYMNHRKFLDPDHKWRFDKRRFNGQIEMGQPPAILSGTNIEDLLSNFQNQFGKKKKEPGQKKVKKVDSPFKKKSLFFNLPYWSHNLHRHNLDVMHIEKNVCDNILGTLLNMVGKTKGHVNARLDLQELGIRKALHLVRSLDGKHLEIRAVVFDMTNKEKDLFCAVLKNVKLPYGSASNISRYVHTKERKISGYKSHDARFLLHYLLQFAVKKSLKPEVATIFIRLGAFLRGIWSKVIDLNELRRLQQEIMEILCQFENIFVNAFFDIMVHLLSKPEGSIAEGYLAEEGLTFFSRFLGGDSGSKITKLAKFGSCPEKLEYHIGTRRNKDGKSIHLKESQWMAIHRYILFNSGNKEIESLIE